MVTKDHIAMHKILFILCSLVVQLFYELIANNQKPFTVSVAQASFPCKHLDAYTLYSPL